MIHAFWSRISSEIGIRMALGAPRTTIVRFVVGQGAIVAGFGLAIGVVAARLLTRFLQSLMLGVSPTDTWVFVATIVGLLTVALAACAVPLYHALTIDPAISLRAEC